MDAWAGSPFGSKANFVCVCVAGSVDLALEFGRSLKLRHCTNGVIVDNSQMPRWGQLGCNGLIILDENLEVVVPASRAFMEIREAAFRDVERILRGMLTPKFQPVFAAGTSVRLIGLKGSAHLNGTTATIITPATSGDGRNVIRLDAEDRREVQIKTANLTRADGMFSPGEIVTVQGLKGSAQFNGMSAVVMKGNDENGRNVVRLVDGGKQELSVKTANLSKSGAEVSANGEGLSTVQVDQPVPSKA